MREATEQAQSIERKRFKEPTGPLLWAGEAASRVTQLLSAREASPRTILFDRPEDRFFYAAIDFWTAACSFAGRMESTGQGARRTTLSVTLPSRMCVKPLLP